MKRLIAGCLAALCLAGGALASEGGAPWDKFPKERVSDLASLQNGAKLFVNYCLNCHAASFVRYNKLQELGLTDAQIKDNLMFAGDKVGDLMTISMSAKDAKTWFGATPPDLALVARSRAGAQGSGADYLYTFLRGFYRDDAKPTGWNNTAFPSVGMPNPLWELQGQRAPVFHEEVDPHDSAKKVVSLTGFTQLTPGKYDAEGFNSEVADLVAFMQWMGEPAQNHRFRLGVGVLLFLLVLTVFAWRLNAAFWKDVK
ncbi:MAG: cytochrome c1 [Proteobacteria bacterium]|nr:cytochrome c1 [Pseudomonadota bacterium]